MANALARKLQIKPGATVLLLDAPAGYEAQLGEVPGVRTVRDGSGPFDVVQAFVEARADVDGAARRAIGALRGGGVLWMCYRKGGARAGTDLNRDNGWEPLRDAGWRAVAQVAVDEAWSALRFRPEADVGR